MQWPISNSFLIHSFLVLPCLGRKGDGKSKNLGVLILLRGLKKNRFCLFNILLKFLYSEKATKFCEISTLLLSTVHTDKSKVKILQNFVAFLEYMNFKEKNGKKWDIELEINVLGRLKCMSANPQKAIYFQYLNIQRAFYIHQMFFVKSGLYFGCWTCWTFHHFCRKIDYYCGEDWSLNTQITKNLGQS